MGKKNFIVLKGGVRCNQKMATLLAYIKKHWGKPSQCAHEKCKKMLSVEGALCGGCYAAVYCNSACQAQNWTDAHRYDCIGNKPKREREMGEEEDPNPGETKKEKPEEVLDLAAFPRDVVTTIVKFMNLEDLKSMRNLNLRFENIVRQTQFDRARVVLSPDLLMDPDYRRLIPYISRTKEESPENAGHLVYMLYKQQRKFIDTNPGEYGTLVTDVKIRSSSVINWNDLIRVSSIEKLDLDNIEMFPETFGELSRLRELRLRKLDVLPDSLERLSWLHTFNLANNRLNALPEWFGRLSSLHTLNLKRNRLTALPESFGQLSSLHTLNLWGNRLTALPESFGQLSSLHTLQLTGNQLTTLPASFGKLLSLHTLVLTENELTTLPESFGRLLSLRELILEDNGLTTLPESFGRLSSLRELYLMHNNLVVLPESFGKLLSLRILSLAHNQLTALPDSFNRLSSLYWLDLRDNDIPEEEQTKIKQTLHFIKNLDF